MAITTLVNQIREKDEEAFEQIYDELTTSTRHSGNQLPLR